MMRQERLRLCEEDAHGAVDRIGHVVLCVRAGLTVVWQY